MVNLAPVSGAPRSREDDLYRAVRDTVADEYELLGELGRGERGTVVYLARERASGSLVALKLEHGPTGGDADYELSVVSSLDDSIPAPASSCPYCRRQIQGWARFCPQCGRDISGEAEAANAGSGYSTEQLLAAVRDSAADDYEVLGEMPRTRGGGRVYFARDRATGAIVALRLQRDQSNAGDQFSLGVTQVLKPLVADMGAQYASPTAVSAPTAPPRPPSAAPPAARGAPDRAPPPAAARPPASGVASAPAQPRPPAPEGRTVVGIAPVSPPPSGGDTSDAIPVETIDPASRRTRMRRRVLIGAGLAVAFAGALALTLAGDDDVMDSAGDTLVPDTVVATEPPQSPPNDPPPVVDTTTAPPVDRTVLVVTGDLPAGTTLTVNGRPIPGRRITLTSGSHMLAARAAGYEPFSQRIRVVGDTTTWSPRLRRVEPPRDTVAKVPDPQPKADPGPTCTRATAAQDWTNARTLCRRDGAAGNVAAQREVGIMLLRGLGGPVDEGGALNWLGMAATADDPVALFELGRIYQRRRDAGRAYDYYRRASLRGHAEAQLQAGRALEHGSGTTQNLREAFLMYEQSAKNGFAAGQNAYGVFLKKGLGTRRDDVKALEWLTKAAQGGSPEAHFHIGELHEQGRAGLPKSRPAAVDWYRKGAALGSAEARRALRQ